MRRRGTRASGGNTIEDVLKAVSASLADICPRSPRELQSRHEGPARRAPKVVIGISPVVAYRSCDTRAAPCRCVPGHLFALAISTTQCFRSQGRVAVATPSLFGGRPRTVSSQVVRPDRGFVGASGEGICLGMRYGSSEGSGRGYVRPSRVTLRVSYANVHTFSHVSCPLLFPGCISFKFPQARGGRLKPSERCVAWGYCTVGPMSLFYLIFSPVRTRVHKLYRVVLYHVPVLTVIKSMISGGQALPLLAYCRGRGGVFVRRHLLSSSLCPYPSMRTLFLTSRALVFAIRSLLRILWG